MTGGWGPKRLCAAGFHRGEGKGADYRARHLSKSPHGRALATAILIKGRLSFLVSPELVIGYYAWLADMS